MTQKPLAALPNASIILDCLALGLLCVYLPCLLRGVLKLVSMSSNLSLLLCGHFLQCLYLILLLLNQWLLPRSGSSSICWRATLCT